MKLASLSICCSCNPLLSCFLTISCCLSVAPIMTPSKSLSSSQIEFSALTAAEHCDVSSFKSLIASSGLSSKSPFKSLIATYGLFCTSSCKSMIATSHLQLVFHVQASQAYSNEEPLSARVYIYYSSTCQRRETSILMEWVVLLKTSVI